MNFNEKLGLLERGLKRRVDNLPQYVMKLETERQRVISIASEFDKMLEQYKGDEKTRKELLKDERLCAIAGGKNKLKKIFYDKPKFLSILETGKEEFLKNYGIEERRFKNLIDDATQSLPDAERILELIKYNKIDKEVLEPIINLFLLPILVDWRDFEEFEKEKEQEKIQENIQDSE
jgi:hypothetical protein